MFSKLSKYSLLIGAALAMVGCELPLNETPPAPKPIEVALGDTAGCLSRVMPVVKVYFEGAAAPGQIDATWSCVSSALETFEKSVQGRYEDRFTVREVAHFIEQYFLEDGSRIPDPLMIEIFRIKQLFVGGAVDSITRTEMKNLGMVVKELRTITLDLNVYMNVFTLKWDATTLRDLNSNHFEDSNKAIQKAAKDLSAIIEKNGMPYRLEYIANLLRQFESFAGEGWAWISDVEKALPLVQKVKKALAGGSEDEIAPSEWRQFALLGARGYVQYLRYHYFIESKTWSSGGTQVSYFTKSISDLFSYLGDMVDSKPGKKLTSEELVEMLKAITLLLPKVKVSDELVLELMKIKVVFFGGRIDFFEKADFDRAQGKLATFQDMAELFLKYSDVYGMSWKPGNMPATQAESHFVLAEENLAQVIVRLASIMEDGYDLQNIIILADEIEKLYPPEPNETSVVASAKKFVPSVIALKNILFSDHSSVIGAPHSTQTASQQWGDFLGLAGKAYSRFLYYDYFLAKKSLTTGSGLEGFNQLVQKSLDIVDGLVDRKQNSTIGFVELSRLWKAVLQTELLPKKISQTSLDLMTKILLQKLLNSPEARLLSVADPVNYPLPDGLSRISTKILRAEFGFWVENQKFLDVAYKNVPAAEGKSGAAILVDLGSATSTIGLRELQMIYDIPLPLAFDPTGRWCLSLPADSDQAAGWCSSASARNYLRKTSDQMNFIRAAVRLATRGYAGDLARIQNYEGVNLAETQLLYTEVKPLLVEIGLIHPKNDDFAENRFRDANLFTSIADGGDLADFRELNTLFMMIMSGLKLDSMMFEKYEKLQNPNCKVTKPTDYSDDWTTDLQCVLDFYRTEMPAVFDSAPDYMAFQASLDQKRFEAMFMNLLKSAGHSSAPTVQPQTDNLSPAAVDQPPIANQPQVLVHIGDLALVPHVIQYLEGFFQLYDVDRDGILSTTEAMKAFPVFRSTLVKVSPFKSEKELRGLFSWVLKNGKPPTVVEAMTTFKVWCQKTEATWDLNKPNRERLAAILGFIAEALENQKPKPKPHQ